MVKHQRRSHQRCLRPNVILDDCASESDIGEPPTTPGQTMSWPMQEASTPPTLAHGHPMRRAASFAFDHHVNQYGLPEQMDSRHSMPAEVHEAHAQDASMQMVHRHAGTPQQAYYLIDQNNLGIATMDPNVHHAYHIPQRQFERPVIEMPYSTKSMASISSSSPVSFSSVPGHSQAIRNDMYTHQSPPTSTCSLQHTISVESKNNMVSYTQGVQQTQVSQSEDEWGYQYQPSVEVATFGQISAFGSGVYNVFSGPQIGFDDPTMQLPNS
ncbi:hypothetical protein MGU_11364 [Metarhizium guizhouense ARSEF 977]|uniref:Uncharacterized protein n=1 Tax=Metarhizium guizhouense (strain ARSEF 977) TaxID=1276136 RepID=A0A0B4HPA7_METGA|nr:hypothetical protein MGU_11364 [Metarhizium guizhouense ARSEF 977]